jgi:hypothetical protein
MYSYRKFAPRYYTVLYYILPTHVLPCAYDTTAVDAAVTSLIAIVQDPTEQAVPHGFITKSKLTQWFSTSFRYYARKKLLSRSKNKKSNYFYRNIFFYQAWRA